MITLEATMCGPMAGDMKRRMENHPEVFRKAVGEELYPGTLNVRADSSFFIKEHFRILGSSIGEDHQDLLFEVCRIRAEGMADTWAYRIRPFDLRNGSGGHGDDVLEIACTQQLSVPFNLQQGTKVELSFFR